jgi:hypothetical protein
MFLDPRWPAPAVNDPVNEDRLTRHRVKDRKGKSPAQRAMIIPVNDAVNSTMNLERFDVETQTLPKVNTETSLS